MEKCISQKSILIMLLGVSVIMTGCTRQLLTSLVSSDDELPQQFAGLSDSSSAGKRVVSAPSSLSQSTSSDSPQGGDPNQVAVELPPTPNLGQSGIDSSFMAAGLGQGADDLQSRGLNAGQFQQAQQHDDSKGNALLNGRESQSGFDSRSQANGNGIVPKDSQGSSSANQGDDVFASSSFDEITPLHDQDLLTEMAAASGQGTLTNGGNGGASSGQKGVTLLPLGDELLGAGSLGDVFFDFDAAVIRSDAAPVLEANAQILKVSFENRQVVIEGHCDERGTAEYNLVLGERRAHSTKRYLVDLGVSPSSIQTISYGKEKPFCTASQPDCWKMNRRGHFVVQ